MKNTKRLLAMLLCVTLSLSIFATTVSAASGTCEVFYFNECGVGPGGTASIQSSLQNMGYTANRYADTHAYYVRRTMHQDKVFAVVTHGAPGLIACGEDTTMSAKAVSSDDANYSLAAWFGEDSLQGLSFAYYGACESALTDTTYGNLLTYTTGLLGAKCALGFSEVVWDPYVTYYETKLFSYLGNGYSVNLSNILARSATYNTYGTYGEVDSAVISGDSSTKIYTTSAAALAENVAIDPDEVALVKNLSFNSARSGITAVSTTLHDEMFEHDLDALQDNNYLYLFDTESKSLEIVALANDVAAPSLGSINSENDAIDVAKQFASNANKSFSIDNCVTFCSVYDFNGESIYSVELWEKVSDNFYTGNKVAIMLDSNGVLQSYVADSEVAVNRATIGAQKHISEATAINTAYAAIVDSAEELEVRENDLTCVPKTGSDIIVSDAGEEIERYSIGTNNADYSINVSDAKNHTVSAYKELRDGAPCWVVTIERVETNRFWTISFSVIIDAITGNVISVENTR